MFVPGSFGRTLKNRNDGTRSSAFIVSFVDFTSSARVTCLLICCVNFRILLKLRRIGPWNFSPAPMELCDSTSERSIIITIPLVRFLRSDEVNTDLWSTFSFSGAPVYMQIQHYINTIQIASVDMLGSKNAFEKIVWRY